MTDPRELLGLPRPTARLLMDFIARPALHLHPQRAATLLPPGWPAGGPRRAASRALMRQLDPHPALDLRQALHRAALLPPVALQALARRLALRDQAGRLRRIILRTERAALAAHIDAAEWRWLLAPTTLPSAKPLAQPALAELPHWLAHSGWHWLQAASRGLPDSVAQRLALKLPLPLPAPVADSLSTEAARDAVAELYPQVAQDWDPQWESGWQAWLKTH